MSGPAPDQILYCLSHLGRGETNAVSMPGEHPLEAVVQQLLNGLHHRPRSPDQAPRCFERSSLGIPPEVVAGEQKPTIVEQCNAARGVARHRDELESWSEADGLQPIDDPF